jgi:N-acetylmuramoyl-L-alanine amidase
MTEARVTNTTGRAAVVVGLLALAFSLAPAGPFDVAGHQLPTRTVGGVEYVQLARLAAAYGGRTWSVNGRYFVLLPGEPGGTGDEYVFRPESTRAMRGGIEITLPAAPKLDGASLLLPVVDLPGLFPAPTGAWLKSLVTAARGETLIVTVGVQRTNGDSVIAVGERPSTLEYRLTIGARPASEFVSQARLLAVTGSGPLRTLAVDSSAGTRLQFSFRRPSGGRVDVRNDVVQLAVWPLPERTIKRIVLDPGHGGTDPGAVGRLGTREQAITFDVTRRLRRKLQAAGYEVTVTRDSGQFCPLADRSQCAARARADLFVSIHANASPNRKANGLEVYFLSEAKTDWERAVAARENAVVELESDSGPAMTDDLQLILADLAQNEYLHESSELAQRIQEATVGHARIMDRGVRQANFYVLRNTFAPAVLVEVGFLSNKSEEKLLRRADHREKLAEGISRGIVEFGRRYQQRANGS